MDIGCHLPTQGPVATREALLTFCREAEHRQIASLWVSDHVIFPRTATGRYPGGRFPFAPDTPYLEPVAVLAAARTEIGKHTSELQSHHDLVCRLLLEKKKNKQQKSHTTSTY